MLKIRNINKEPGKVSTYSLNQFNRVVTDEGTDIKNHSREIKEDYARRLQKKNKFINDHNGEPIYFYRRLQHGRRCSCFDGFNTPSADCPICFKTGVVGGFLKYGTHQHIMDASAQGVNMVNVHPSLELKLRPLNFVLDEGAIKGYIQFDFDILQVNHRIVDTINFLYSGTNKNATIKTYVKRPAEAAYVSCTKQSVEERLDSEVLSFKIEMSRQHPDVPSPKISHFWLRYLILESCELPLDIAPSTTSITLDDLGQIKNAQPVQVFFDQRLGYVESEDFIYRLEENSLWKPLDTTKKKSVGVRTSTDVTLRIVQDFEPYARFPL